MVQVHDVPQLVVLLNRSSPPRVQLESCVMHGLKVTIVAGQHLGAPTRLDFILYRGACVWSYFSWGLRSYVRSALRFMRFDMPVFAGQGLQVVFFCVGFRCPERLTKGRVPPRFRTPCDDSYIKKKQPQKLYVTGFGHQIKNGSPVSIEGPGKNLVYRIDYTTFR